MEWFWLVFWALVAGVIIGPLARLVIPGKQDIGVFATIVAGAIGALAGGLIAQALGVGATSGIDWIKLLIQVGAGALAVLGFVAIKK
jgi:uncharacterized membrane protein YeaQ/YmgE (transglycosylase-associated protein family)